MIILTALLLLLTSISVAYAEEGVGESEEVPISLCVVTMPTRTQYAAFDSFDASGMTVLAELSDGETLTLGEDDITVEYITDEDRLRYGDSGVFISYRGFRILLPLEVRKRDYEFDPLTLVDECRTYNGEWQTVDGIPHLPTGLDGIPLLATVTGGGRDVGVYTVSVTFSTESRDYRVPEPLTARLEISPYTLTVNFTDTDFVYDGTPKLPRATAKNERGETVELLVQGEGVYASDSYIAHAIAPSDNYRLSGAAVTYRIRRADYDVREVRWSASDFTYDGEEKSVFLTGLPSGITLLGYEGERGTGAGKYTARAILRYDTRNYNPPSVPDLEWEIARASYDMSGASFSGCETVYNGEEQRVSVVGLPDGVSVIAVLGGVGTDAGSYPVSVILDYDEENYNPPTLSDAVLVIAKKRVAIPEAIRIVYEGKREEIDLSAEEYYQKTAFFTDLIGRYRLELVLFDPDNYIFEDGGATATVPITVLLPTTATFALGTLLFVLFILFALAVLLVVRRERIRRLFATVRCKTTHGEKILLPSPSATGGALALLSVSCERANELITDSLAKSLLIRELMPIYTTGRRKSIINVDTLGAVFSAGERVDVNILKERGLIPPDTAYLKILGGGRLDKPLFVYANDFSLSAVKMIALTGGTATRVVTLRKKRGKNK